MSDSPETPPVDPSQTAGSTLPAYQEQLQRSMAEVIPLLSAPEAEQRAFIDRRIAELSPTDTALVVGEGGQGTDTFIAPDTDVVGGDGLMVSKPYRLDDPEAYRASFAFIAAAMRGIPTDMDPAKGYVNAVLRGVNKGQAAYFESAYGDKTTRQGLVADLIDDDVPERRSIAEYKGAAVCMERSAVAHNTLLILGVKSRIEIGDLSFDGKEKSAIERHAFQVVESAAGQPFIYDVTNPVQVVNEAGELTDIRPAFYPLDVDENLDQHVEQRQLGKVDGRLQTVGTHGMTYSFDAPPKEMSAP